MSRLFLALLFSLGGLQLLFSQAVEFEKSYDIYLDDRFHDFLLLPDAGFLLVGETELPAGTTHILLVRVNPSGDTLWTKTYGGELLSSGRRIIQLADGNCLIAGAFNGQAAVLKVNPEGGLLWMLEFDEPNAGGICQDVIETANHELIITRVVNLLPESSVLFRTDTLGTVAWEMVEGGTNLVQIDLDENNDLVVSGSRVNCFEPWIFQGKFHTAGIPIYTHDYDSFTGLGFCHTLHNVSGSFIGGLEMQEYSSISCILGVAPDGELAWKKNYYGSGRITAITNNGTRLFATTYSEGMMNLMVLNLAGDSLGGLLFQQYDIQVCQKARVYGNSLFLAGYRFDWGDGGEDATFIRINTDSIPVAVNPMPAPQKNHLLVYPNPVSQQLHIDLAASTSARITAVQVYDLRGNLLRMFHFPATSASTLDLSMVSGGHCLLQVSFDDHTTQSVKCLVR